MAEQIEEMRLCQEKQADELRTRTNSLDARFDKLETTIFTFLSQVPAPGKQPIMMPGGSSSSPNPLSSVSDRPPDPPDLGGFMINDPPMGQNRPSLLPNRLASRLTKVGFPLFEGSDLRD